DERIRGIALAAIVRLRDGAHRDLARLAPALEPPHAVGDDDETSPRDEGGLVLRLADEVRVLVLFANVADVGESCDARRSSDGTLREHSRSPCSYDQRILPSRRVPGRGGCRGGRSTRIPRTAQSMGTSAASSAQRKRSASSSSEGNADVPASARGSVAPISAPLQARTIDLP